MKLGSAAGRETIETVVAAAIAVVLTLWPADVIYGVSASTESVSMTTSRDSLPWRFDGARITDQARTRDFTGWVLPRAGIRAVMRRVGDGPLRIRLELPQAPAQLLAPATPHSPNTSEPLKAVIVPPDGALATLRGDDDQPVGKIVGPTASIMLDRPFRPPGETLVMSVTGALELSGGPNLNTYGPVPMLRSGTVSMSAPTLLGSERYFTGREILDAGDEFRIVHAKEGHGFVRIDDQPGLTVIYRAVGSGSQVSRFGHEGYSFGTSVLAKLQNDSVLQVLWSFVGFLFLRRASSTRRSRGATSVLVLLMLVSTVVPAAAGSACVHVVAGEHGVGMPRWWAHRCYVITPAHVVADAHGEIGLVAPRRRPARAELHWRNDGMDLAVLRVTEGAEFACSDRTWTPSPPLDDLLARYTQGTLRSVGEDGGERRMPVLISKVQNSHVEVAPALAGAEIAQGQSGSILEVAGRAAGVLLQATAQHRGRVIRQDYLDQVLTGAFPSSDWPTPGSSICLRHDAVTKSMAEALADAIAGEHAQALDCGRRRDGRYMLELTGIETTDVMPDVWIVSIQAVLVLTNEKGAEVSRRRVRVAGSSTIDEKRAREAVRDELHEQIVKEGLSVFVRMTTAEDQAVGGINR